MRRSVPCRDTAAASSRPRRPGRTSTASPIARTLASRLACVSMTPLGSPVEPEVYCSSARSRCARGMPVMQRHRAPMSNARFRRRPVNGHSARRAAKAPAGAAAAPPLPPRETSAAAAPRNCAGYSIAAPRIPQSGRREMADRSAPASRPPAARRRKKKKSRDVGSISATRPPAGTPRRANSAAQRCAAS